MSDIQKPSHKAQDTGAVYTVLWARHSHGKFAKMGLHFCLLRYKLQLPTTFAQSGLPVWHVCHYNQHPLEPRKQAQTPTRKWPVSVRQMVPFVYKDRILGRSVFHSIKLSSSGLMPSKKAGKSASLSANSCEVFSSPERRSSLSPQVVLPSLILNSLSLRYSKTALPTFCFPSKVRSECPRRPCRAATIYLVRIWNQQEKMWIN